MEIVDRITRLRSMMREEGLQAYLVPSTDCHQNEYLPDCWKRRHFISGFTGSAGEVAITRDEAGLWTDGRYFIQAEEQLEGTGISLFKKGQPEVPELEDWLARKLADGGVLGVDPKLLSMESAAKLEKALAGYLAAVNYLERNLVDEVWERRPALVSSPLEILPLEVVGSGVAEKLQAVREKLSAKDCEAHLLGPLDAIAWLFNLRGSDIEFNRVFLSYAVITQQQAHVFLAAETVTSEVQEHLAGLVEIHPYVEIYDFLETLELGKGRLWIDPKTTSQWLGILVGKRFRVFENRSPVIDLKATKNETELQGFRRCHEVDGAAMVRFLKWLENAVGKGGVTELSASEKLAEFRAEQPGFAKLSFCSIVGYAAHGAINHYEVTPQSALPLKPEGLFLVDSGGHYVDGTTDITRTLALGEPSREQCEHFTRVLKGMIQLIILKFPEGTSGKQLDLMARKALWEIGANFNHGTGHGVGHCLNVHEGPMGISPRDPGVPFTLGNVLSNEPGYYKAGEYGIRIENLMAVRQDEELSSPDQRFFRFENITFCPIDLRLVTKSLLSEEELIWLNDYHREVYEKVAPHLDEEHRVWLRQQTRAI